MSLKIEGIIEGAEKIREKIAVELPGHTGLAGALEEIQRRHGRPKRSRKAVGDCSRSAVCRPRSSALHCCSFWFGPIGIFFTHPE